MNLVLIFDTETTGLPQFKEPSEGVNQPHIVQLAALLVDVDTRKIIQSMDVIVKPDGWEIPAEVAEIHGITTEYALQVGIPEKQAVEMFLALWAGRLRVAHNTTFDNRIIRIATKRFCTEDVIESWHDGEYQCTGLLTKPIMQMLPKNKYGFKMPKLSEAYKHFFGVELENAHSAMADAKACMDVYFAVQYPSIDF